VYRVLQRRGPAGLVCLRSADSDMIVGCRSHVKRAEAGRGPTSSPRLAESSAARFAVRSSRSGDRRCWS
jgi:hypothetical protein